MPACRDAAQNEKRAGPGRGKGVGRPWVMYREGYIGGGKPSPGLMNPLYDAHTGPGIPQMQYLL